MTNPKCSHPETFTADVMVKECSQCHAIIDHPWIAEIERLKAHEHVAATILATALACDNYQPQHMEWMAEAARWLNEPRAHSRTREAIVTKEELDGIRAAFERDYDPYFWRKLGKDEPSDPFRLAITHVGQLLELIREQGYEPAHEPKVCASRDADHCDYPDCEQHWTHVVAQARALLEPLAEHDPAIRQWLKTPDLPSLTQGASRDASSGESGE